jgi:hypothetical protein
MRGSLEGSLNAPRMKMVDADCIWEVAERVVMAAAKTGNSVIVGLGSGYYLRDRPDVFHVFIYARLKEKVRRLREIGKSEEEAVELAETVDRDRSAYIKQYFGVEWPPLFLSPHDQFHARRRRCGPNDLKFDGFVREAACLIWPA